MRGGHTPLCPRQPLCPGGAELCRAGPHPCPPGRGPRPQRPWAGRGSAAAIRPCRASAAAGRAAGRARAERAAGELGAGTESRLPAALPSPHRPRLPHLPPAERPEAAGMLRRAGGDVPLPLEALPSRQPSGSAFPGALAPPSLRVLPEGNRGRTDGTPQTVPALLLGPTPSLSIVRGASPRRTDEWVSSSAPWPSLPDLLEGADPHFPVLEFPQGFHTPPNSSCFCFSQGSEELETKSVYDS